jgi:thiosulfate/3-mercaptopyruvate sulfurtransferase
MLLVVATAGYTDQVEAKEYVNASLLTLMPELAHRLGEAGLRILDARAAERYGAGHIPGAVNLPIADITRTINGVPGMLTPIEELEQILGRRGITREDRVVIYDDVGGLDAARLFWALDYLGHPRLSVLQGGVALWQRDGGATSREVATPEAVQYRSEPRPERLADRAWVQASLQNPAVILLDARSPEEFTGAVPGKEVRRPGRIPGAVNLDWVGNLTAAEPRRFKSAADLESLYRSAGVTPDKEIAIYCRTGARASHTYFVLRLLGYPRVRVYDGSFIEWSADATLPVAR